MEGTVGGAKRQDDRTISSVPASRFPKNVLSIGERVGLNFSKGPEYTASQSSGEGQAKATSLLPGGFYSDVSRRSSNTRALISSEAGCQQWTAISRTETREFYCMISLINTTSTHRARHSGDVVVHAMKTGPMQPHNIGPTDFVLKWRSQSPHILAIQCISIVEALRNECKIRSSR